MYLDQIQGVLKEASLWVPNITGPNMGHPIGASLWVPNITGPNTGGPKGSFSVGA